MRHTPMSEVPAQVKNSKTSESSRGLLLLLFQIEGDRFGLKATHVQEVVRAVAIAPLPKAPAIVEGVINVRGRIVPVLDVRGRFGLRPKLLHPDQHFILAFAGARFVALRVDRAAELLSVDTGALEAAERSTPGVGYVAGIATLPDGLVVIHDLAAFLSLDEASELDAATSATSGARA